MLNEARAILAALKADPDVYAVALPIYKALPKTFCQTLAFLTTEEEVEASYRRAYGLPKYADVESEDDYYEHLALNYRQVGKEFIDLDMYESFLFDLVCDARLWLSGRGLNSTEDNVIGHYEAWISKRHLQEKLAADLTSNAALSRKRKI